MTVTYKEEILQQLKKYNFNVEFSVLKHDYTIPVFYTKVRLIDGDGRAVEGIGFSDDEPIVAEEAAIENAIHIYDNYSDVAVESNLLYLDQVQIIIATNVTKGERFAKNVLTVIKPSNDTEIADILKTALTEGLEKGLSLL